MKIKQQNELNYIYLLQYNRRMKQDTWKIELLTNEILSNIDNNNNKLQIFGIIVVNQALKISEYNEKSICDYKTYFYKQTSKKKKKKKKKGNGNKRKNQFVNIMKNQFVIIRHIFINKQVKKRKRKRKKGMEIKGKINL
eukprot:552163_1